MLKRTEGIVLRTALFGEADLIVTYLTRDFGIVPVFAKSPRKMTSRFGSSLEPLTYARISFIGKEDANLPRLTQSDILRPFHAVRTDVACLSDVAEMIELSLHLLAERDPHAGVFGLLLDTLEKLDVERDNPLCFLHFKIRLLEAAGFAPRFGRCGRCGKTASDDGPHVFYLSQGSTMCGACATEGGEPFPLSDGAVKLYGSLMKWPTVTIDRVRAPDRLLSELRRVIDTHISYLVTGPLRSLRMPGAFGARSARREKVRAPLSG